MRLSVATLKSSFGSNCGEQLFGFAVALTNSCFEERQLWEVVLERNFGKPLSETTFGGLALWEAISGNNLGERQLSGIILRNIFFEAQQLSSRFTKKFGK